ncbi:MAG: 3-oxoacyl-(acyl-carrier-protein) synthase [Granulosicoccus sp.]|jgi:3-oxoacyl-(acyl-carrier-protein) synthase
MSVAVTGMGIICAIGLGADEVWENLSNNRSGIGPAEGLNTPLSKTHVFGQIKLTNSQLIAGIDEDAKGLSRTSLLSIVAIKEALASSGMSTQDVDGLISGTTVGGMDRSENFFSDRIQKNDNSKINALLTHSCGDTTTRVAHVLGINGKLETVCTACSSSANSIMLGKRMIESGKYKKVLVGGVDPLTAFTANGFNSLMILDPLHTRPMSGDRKGLNLGEGAAFLVLESEDSAKQRGANILGSITGCGNTNDAYHATASSPDGDGAYLSMTKALSMAGIKASEVDYINAHGTGTPNNDESESKAVDRVFGSDVPSISSTKGFTGHTLGAAGAIEAVLSLLTIKHQKALPNHNYSEPMPETDWEPVKKMQDQKIDHVMSNSFGFGGNNSTIIISKAK